MDFKRFINELKQQNTDEKLLDFSRKYVLHGIPFVFEGKEDEYYEFRKRISINFNISFHEVYITGSGKLGFSLFKKGKIFDYNSDIDVALISSSLFEVIMKDISHYQMNLRQAREKVQEDELNKYHIFLEYIALGWIRPDKLPTSFRMKTVKNNWFEFFKGISYGHSEVGNYKVNAGIFKNYEYFEEYTVEGLKKVRNRYLMEKK